ncbi:MAG: type II toxin-antitoxin system VapC family toxin [Chitinispirillaceae bacterium]|nr:type II toxin-antitoxin system VapC family toxin [Chitinispirillaceae bacterium]
MKKVVVDTSVIIACLLNEPEKARLEELTDGIELIAPGSLPWEVGNALSAAFKKKRFSNPDAACAVANEFGQIPVRLVHVDIAASIDLCFKRGIYAYDAYVIICAQQIGAPLLTLDRHLAEIALQEKVKVMEVFT